MLSKGVLITIVLLNKGVFQAKLPIINKTNSETTLLITLLGLQVSEPLIKIVCDQKIDILVLN